ncbi:hypothetical protein ARUE_c13090 [Arthrobacter sp. Rue61a]|nr:hypothetical protein ARUE_c13090 [Arthrobacter sp. Rue61a]
MLVEADRQPVALTPKNDERLGDAIGGVPGRIDPAKEYAIKAGVRARALSSKSSSALVEVVTDSSLAGVTAPAP